MLHSEGIYSADGVSFIGGGAGVQSAECLQIIKLHGYLYECLPRPASTQI